MLQPSKLRAGRRHCIDGPTGCVAGGGGFRGPTANDQAAVRYHRNQRLGGPGGLLGVPCEECMGAFFGQ